MKFEDRIEELVPNSPDLAGLVEPLLVVRRVLHEQIVILLAACWPLSGMIRCAGA